MKKGHILILVLVMSAALIGLLSVQWFWVRNAVALREKQFHFRVKSALESVAERLQDREIAIAINNGQYLGLPFILQPFIPKPSCDNENDDPRNKPKENDSTGSTFFHHRFASYRLANGQMLNQTTAEKPGLVDQGDIALMQMSSGLPTPADYVHGLVERMLQSARPLHERLNYELLDTLLREELSRREIDEPFIYGIRTEGFVPNFIKREERVSPVDRSGNYFRVMLFPHDIRPSEHFLELQFPEHTNPTLRAMGVVLPTSGILVLIVMLCFGIALLAFKRQQKLSDLKTDFINNMTHELKTPISTISLALEALGDPDMQTKEGIGMYARLIGQENDRLKIQVDRVLQAAALERGDLNLELQPIDLDTLLLDQIERIRLHVEGRGGHIHLDFQASDTTVMADEVHIGGVIFNLLDNANKYSPNTPDITIRTANVGKNVEITVQDTGLGIDSESQKRVFEKFFRVPTGNVHNVKGFGIGLNYSKSMAKAHGGDIRLESQFGKGSAFTLSIPTYHNPA